MMDPVTAATIGSGIKELADEVYEKVQDGKKAGYTDEDAAVEARKKEKAEEIFRRSGEIGFLIVGKSGVGKSEWLERMQGRPPRPEAHRARTIEVVEMIAVFPYAQDKVIVKNMNDVPGEKRDSWLEVFTKLQPDGIIFMVDYPSENEWGNPNAVL